MIRFVFNTSYLWNKNSSCHCRYRIIHFKLSLRILIWNNIFLLPGRKIIVPHSKCVFLNFKLGCADWIFVIQNEITTDQDNIYPFVPTVAFSQLSSNICCPRDCVSRHNGGTSGAPLKPLRDDSALRALSSLRGLRVV